VSVAKNGSTDFLIATVKLCLQTDTASEVLAFIQALAFSKKGLDL
jgi:hypothetical protein